MKQNSFMRRLLISFLTIAVIPLTVITAIYFYNTIQLANESGRQQLGSAADQVNTQLDSLLSNMSFISGTLVSNENFMNSVEQLETADSGALQRKYYDHIYSEIRSYAYFSPMHNVTFFNDDGFVVTTYSDINYNHTYRLSKEERDSIGWYSQVQNNFGQAVVVPVRRMQIPDTGERCLSVVRAIRNPGKNVGYLCVDIAEEDLKSLLQMEETINADLLIVNTDGTVIYKSENFPAEAENDTVDLEKLDQLGGSYFVERRYNELNTMVYMSLSRNAAYEESYKNLVMLGLQTFCLLCLTCLVVLIFIKDLSRPLMALRREMEETTLSNLQDQGNEKLFNRFEEISYLYRQFHEMRERLDLMVQREMENKTMYLEERMNYLQAQINPHFMCNTLNVIGIMGSEHGAQQVQDACLQLSSLLQYSIGSKADGQATVEEEMQNIRDYLNLMQLRYEHKLEYTIDCDDRMKSVFIPRLVLEPFVENIFAHAYGPNHKTVQVKVMGYIQSGRWYIAISDDGQGMPQEQLQQLQEHIRKSCERLLTGNREKRKYGIGVENTIMRMYLYYGDEFQYVLESGEDAGFRIVLSAKTEEE